MRVTYCFNDCCHGDLSTAIKDMLLEVPGDGTIEDLQHQVRGLGITLGVLLSVLVDRKILTLDDVNQMVEPLYPFKEVE